MKSVLISIKPKYCDLIASGEKTVEVRKNRPKLETPFKCYIYCTRGPSYKNTNYLSEPLYFLGEQFPVNGKVFCEFVCDRIDHFDSAFDEWARSTAPGGSIINSMGWDKFLEIVHKKGCITKEELEKYFPEDVKAYLWHISDLKIYDTPKELSEFFNWVDIGPWSQLTRMTRPPTSWCYVEGLK